MKKQFTKAHLILHNSKTQIMNKLENYREWREFITKDCGLSLSKDYCEARITALEDQGEQSTQSFVKTYGEEYKDNVIKWFQQALKEA